MSIPGFDLAQARYDREEPPSPSDLAAERDTDCLGFYEQTDTDDAYECDQRRICPLCEGIVCDEHDTDVEVCDGESVHAACHAQGCQSQACADDARDDALLRRQEEEDGR